MRNLGKTKNSFPFVFCRIREAYIRFINCCFQWCIWGSLSAWIAKPKRKDRHLIDLIIWLRSSWWHHDIFGIYITCEAVLNDTVDSWPKCSVLLKVCPIPCIRNKKHRQVPKEVLQKSTRYFLKISCDSGFCMIQASKAIAFDTLTWFQHNFNLTVSTSTMRNVRCAKVNRVFAVDASDSGNSWFDDIRCRTLATKRTNIPLAEIPDASRFKMLLVFFSDKRSNVSRLLSDYISLMAWPMSFCASKNSSALLTFGKPKHAKLCRDVNNCDSFQGWDCTLDNVCGCCLMLRIIIHPYIIFVFDWLQRIGTYCNFKKEGFAEDPSPRFGPPSGPLTVAASGESSTQIDSFVSNCLLFNLHNVIM